MVSRTHSLGGYMKNYKILTAVCCLLTLAVCVQAQGVNNNSKKWKLTSQQQEQLKQLVNKRKDINGKTVSKTPEARSIEAILNQKKQDSVKRQKELAKAKQKAEKKLAGQVSGNACAACGEEVRPGQHCAATGYTSLCSSAKEEPAANNAQQESAVCPKCGKTLSIDERYHGIEHKCQKPGNTCAACGEEVRPGQHCAATGYASLSPVMLPCAPALKKSRHKINPKTITTAATRTLTKFFKGTKDR